MTAQTSTPEASRPSTSVSTTGSSSATGNTLVSAHGRTTIADTVVAKIAGRAASEVDGVHALGGGASRAVGALRDRIPGSKTNHAQGLSVEVGEQQAAVDIQLVADFGVSIAALAQSIRRNVISSVERMTGLQVTEVNIEVQDVFVESDDDQDDQSARVV